MAAGVLAVCVLLCCCIQAVIAPNTGHHAGAEHTDPECLKHHCDGRNHDLTQCALDTDNDWHCHDNEVCEIKMNNHDVQMHCKHFDNHQSQDCETWKSQNSGQCDLSSGFTDVGECNYCCPDKNCLEQLLTASATTSVLETTTTSATATATTMWGQLTSVSNGNISPGLHSCFTSSCNQGDDLATCTSGQYACQQGEFCDLQINGEITMSCKAEGDHDRDLVDCLIQNSHNTASCSRYSPADNCRYCCHDHSCVDTLLAPTSAPPSVTTPTSATDYRPGHESCLTSDCGHDVSLAVCTSGHWACKPDEYCRMDADKHGTFHMHCAPVEDVDHCHNEESHNGRWCYPLVGIPVQECHYCCRDATCINNVASLASNPSQIPPVQPATPPPKPGENSCFSTSCDHRGDDLATCVTGQWACDPTEYCRFDGNRNGEIHMHCHKDDDLTHCYTDELRNGPWCHPLVRFPDDDCHYCCRDANCMHDVISPSSTTQITTAATQPPAAVTSPQLAVTSPQQGVTSTQQGVTSTQLVTTTHQPTPGANSCFTTDCQRFDSLSTCVAGQYACKRHQYCKFDANDAGDVRMHCSPLTTLPQCLHHELSDSYHCFPLKTVPSEPCSYCCLDGKCIRVILGVNDPTLPTPAVTNSTHIASTSPSMTSTSVQASTATTATTATTSLSPPAVNSTTHPSTDCKDLYGGNCSEDFAGRCSEKAVQIACPRYCGSCQGSCTDLYLGDCSVVFAGQCSDPTVNDLCQKTCNSCPPDTTSTIATTPMTTADTKTTAQWVHCIDHYTGNCSKYLPGGCSNPLIAEVCEKTCGLCSNQSNGPVTTQASSVTPTATSAPNASVTTQSSGTTTAAATTTTTLPVTTQTSTTTTTVGNLPTIRCVQCGDRATGTPCTDLELLMAVPDACTDPGDKFCMTDAEVDASRNIAIYKRCVDKEICIRDWYRQTSDKHNCMTFNPLIVPPNLMCHFCCVDNGCNMADSVPSQASQWRP